MSYLRARTLIVCLLLVFVPGAGPAQPANEPAQVFREFESFAPRMMTEWKVPGAAVAVVRDGQVVYANGFGSRNLKAGLPVDEHTVFPIASCTKSFTAAALAILVDQGKIAWDRPVRDYLPDFLLKDEQASRTLRVRDLVSHRSGLPRHDWVWIGARLSRAELFARLRYLEPSRPAFAEYQYNNLMFMAAGVLLERVTGSTWEEFVRTRLLTPLEMNDSVLTYPELFERSNYSLSYREEEGKPVEAGFMSAVDAIGPAGSIKASVVDMAHWLTLQLGGGRWNGRQIVSEKNLRETHTPTTLVSPAERKYAELGYAGYGMGWNINTYQGQLRLMHNGSIEGYRSQMTLFPDRGLGVVVLTNTGVSDNYFTNIVSHFLADRLLGLPAIDWHGRLATQQAETKEKEAHERKENEGKRRAGTVPSRALDEFDGTYDHPAYGRLEIQHQGDELQGSFHDRSFSLRHYHYDIFESTQPLEGVKFTFQPGDGGRITRVVASIPNAGDIEFTRPTQ